MTTINVGDKVRIVPDRRPKTIPVQIELMIGTVLENDFESHYDYRVDFGTVLVGGTQERRLIFYFKEGELEKILKYEPPKVSGDWTEPLPDKEGN